MDPNELVKNINALLAEDEGANTTTNAPSVSGLVATPAVTQSHSPPLEKHSSSLSVNHQAGNRRVSLSALTPMSSGGFTYEDSAGLTISSCSMSDIHGMEVARLAANTRSIAGIVAQGSQIAQAFVVLLGQKETYSSLPNGYHSPLMEPLLSALVDVVALFASEFGNDFLHPLARNLARAMLSENTDAHHRESIGAFFPSLYRSGGLLAGGDPFTFMTLLMEQRSDALGGQPSHLPPPTAAVARNVAKALAVNGELSNDAKSFLQLAEPPSVSVSPHRSPQQYPSAVPVLDCPSVVVGEASLHSQPSDNGFLGATPSVVVGELRTENSGTSSIDGFHGLPTPTVVVGEPGGLRSEHSGASTRDGLFGTQSGQQSPRGIARIPSQGSVKSSSSISPSAVPPGRTVYLAKLDPKIKEQELRSMFLGCGPFSKVRVCGTPNSRSLYGFVEFQSSAAAKTMLEYDNREVGSCKMRCSLARTPIHDTDPRDAIFDPQRGYVRACLFGLQPASKKPDSGI